MKNGKKFGWLIFFLLVFQLTHAQINQEFRIGVNFGTISLKSAGYVVAPKIQTGMQAGFLSQIKIFRDFYLQSGLLYTARGSGYDFFGVETALKIQSLEVPLEAACTFSLAQGQMFLTLGPYFQNLFKVSETSSYSTKDVKLGIGDNLKRFDYGVNLGIGCEYLNWRLSVQYQLGLQNLAVQSADQDQNAGPTSISLEYQENSDGIERKFGGGFEKKSNVFTISIGYVWSRGDQRSRNKYRSNWVSR